MSSCLSGQDEGEEDEDDGHLGVGQLDVESGNGDCVGRVCRVADAEKGLFVLGVKHLGGREKRVKDAEAVGHTSVVYSPRRENNGKGGGCFMRFEHVECRLDVA
jgi:hypothetical protein